MFYDKYLHFKKNNVKLRFFSAFSICSGNNHVKELESHIYSSYSFIHLCYLYVLVFMLFFVDLSRTDLRVSPVCPH